MQVLALKHCFLIIFWNEHMSLPKIEGPSDFWLPNVFRSCTKANIFGKVSLRLPMHCRGKRLSVQNVDIRWTWTAVVAALYQGLSLPVPELFLPWSGNFHTCYMMVHLNPQISQRFVDENWHNDAPQWYYHVGGTTMCQALPCTSQKLTP